MNLRWVKMKDWKYGKFKLQVNIDSPGRETWVDVPVVDSSAPQSKRDRLIKRLEKKNEGDYLSLEEMVDIAIKFCAENP